MSSTILVGPCPACKQPVVCEQLPRESTGDGSLVRVNIGSHGCPDRDYWQRGT